MGSQIVVGVAAQVDHDEHKSHESLCFRLLSHHHDLHVVHGLAVDHDPVAVEASVLDEAADTSGVDPMGKPFQNVEHLFSYRIWIKTKDK